jgi:hypothetical protein
MNMYEVSEPSTGPILVAVVDTSGAIVVNPVAHPGNAASESVLSVAHRIVRDERTRKRLKTPHSLMVPPSMRVVDV